MSYEEIELEIEAWLCPCLTLHSDENHYTHPITWACAVNMRPLSLTRLGHNCIKPAKSDKGNLLDQMLAEKANAVPTCLSGGLIMAFTSFSSTLENINIMVPIDHMKREHVNTSTAASALTSDILVTAIRWLNGSDESPPDNNLDTRELLKLYLKTLGDKIRCLHLLQSSDDQKKVFQRMKEFIRGRKWLSSSDTPNCDFLNVTEPLKFDTSLAIARRWIYKHIARETKVVAHILDGNHRIAALEYALGGHTYAKDSGMMLRYLLNLPHADTKLNIRAMLHIGPQLATTFANDMRKISASAQVEIGKMQPHGKRIFYTLMIDRLRESCNHQGITYLLGGNDEIHDDQHIQEHIKSVGGLIVEIIRENGGLYRHMVGETNFDEVLEKLKERGNMDLFLTKKQNKNPARYTYHWDCYKKSLHFIFQNTGDIHTSGRYMNGFPAELFELVQVLLWTRISINCDTKLYRFFEHSIPSVTQISAGSNDKEAKWITCMIATVGTSVFYSNAILKHRKSNPPSIPKLICSAVSISTDFFSSTVGIDPIQPDWFKSLQEEEVTYSGNLAEMNVDDCCDDPLTLKAAIIESVGDKGLGLPKDYLSFITLAFALHLQVAIFLSTKGRSQLKILVNSMITTDCEGIIGVKEQVQQEQGNCFWTTRIEEFSKFITADDPDSSSFIIRLCLKTSLRRILRKVPHSRKEVEHATEETTVQLDIPSADEYSFAKEILNHLASFGEWLKEQKGKNNAKLDEIEDMEHNLGLIDIPIFDKCYVVGQDE